MSIKVFSVSKFYKSQKALDSVSFSADKGQVIGFLGPNGAGKSTTMKILTGFIPATSGEVKICGMEVDVDSLETRKKIGYLPENNPFTLEIISCLSSLFPCLAS